MDRTLFWSGQSLSDIALLVLLFLLLLTLLPTFLLPRLYRHAALYFFRGEEKAFLQELRKQSTYGFARLVNLFTNISLLTIGSFFLLEHYELFIGKSLSLILWSIVAIFLALCLYTLIGKGIDILLWELYMPRERERWHAANQLCSFLFPLPMLAILFCFFSASIQPYVALLIIGCYIFWRVLLIGKVFLMAHQHACYYFPIFLYLCIREAIVPMILVGIVAHYV